MRTWAGEGEEKQTSGGAMMERGACGPDASCATTENALAILITCAKTLAPSHPDFHMSPPEALALHIHNFVL